VSSLIEQLEQDYIRAPKTSFTLTHDFVSITSLTDIKVLHQ